MTKRRGQSLTPAPERFWAKVQKTPDDCWIWSGAAAGGQTPGAKMRGYFMVSNTPEGFSSAKDYAYELIFGEPSPGGRGRMMPEEVCGTEGCINPLHALYRLQSPRVKVNEELSATVRFFSLMQKDAETECWIWHGCATATNPQSPQNLSPYFWGGQSYGTGLAYAFAWRIIAKRSLPPLHGLARICANMLCVNPDHRLLVDRQHTNIMRDRRHGFQTRVGLAS